jgi:hypothetical protein
MSSSIPAFSTSLYAQEEQSIPSQYAMHISEINDNGKEIKLTNGLTWKVNPNKDGYYRVLTTWKPGDEVIFIRVLMFDYSSDGLHNNTLGGTWGKNSIIARYSIPPEQITQLPTVVSVDEDYIMNLSDGTRWQFEPLSFMEWLIGIPVPKAGEFVLIFPSAGRNEYPYIHGYYAENSDGTFSLERRYASLLDSKSAD